MADEIVPQDMNPALLARAKSLLAASDRRPSQEGFAQITVYEIHKMGGWKDPKDESAAPRPSIRILPLCLRETRAYWARKGLGSPPDCRSIDGVVPLKGEDDQPQAENCAVCPWNKFGTAEQGRGKKCKTKGVLFGLEVSPDGAPLGPVVLRFSMSNRQTPAAILACDREAAAMKLPRFFTVWSCETKMAKGAATDFIHFAPRLAGGIPVGVNPEDVLALVERVGVGDPAKQIPPQADVFLSAAIQHDEQQE